MRQATIQGALGGLPLDLVNAHMAGTENFDKYHGWASDILNTGVLSIVICAPLGLLIIGARGAAAVAPAQIDVANPGHVCSRWTSAFGLTRAPDYCGTFTKVGAARAASHGILQSSVFMLECNIAAPCAKLKP